MEGDESLMKGGENFIAKLDGGKIDSRILFKDHLITLSENTGKEVGELTVSIDSSSYSGKECYLVQANSNGIVDTVPVGTNITAYISPTLETLEHTQHEYVNIPGNALTKRGVLSKTEDGYQNVTTKTEAGTETTTTTTYSTEEMNSFVSEGANLALQRLSILHGMHSRISFKVFSADNDLTSVTYAPLESQSISIQSVQLETIGLERSVSNGEGAPTAWNIYFLPDGHMYTRSQVGSPVYMKIRDLPENFIRDEEADWVFPDFGKGKLHWEDDIEMLSQFLDRKDQLKEDHVNYMRRHPELKAILGDFMQFLLMRKPSDVIEFAADFFSAYSSSAEMKPSFAHSDHVNKSAIRSE